MIETTRTDKHLIKVNQSWRNNAKNIGKKYEIINLEDALLTIVKFDNIAKKHLISRMKNSIAKKELGKLIKSFEKTINIYSNIPYNMHEDQIAGLLITTSGNSECKQREWRISYLISDLKTAVQIYKYILSNLPKKNGGPYPNPRRRFVISMLISIFHANKNRAFEIPTKNDNYYSGQVIDFINDVELLLGGIGIELNIKDGTLGADISIGDMISEVMKDKRSILNNIDFFTNNPHIFTEL